MSARRLEVGEVIEFDPRDLSAGVPNAVVGAWYVVEEIVLHAPADELGTPNAWPEHTTYRARRLRPDRSYSALDPSFEFTFATLYAGPRLLGVRHPIRRHGRMRRSFQWVR